VKIESNGSFSIIQGTVVRIVKRYYYRMVYKYKQANKISNIKNKQINKNKNK
jgi:hypothetical protein